MPNTSNIYAKVETINVSTSGINDTPRKPSNNDKQKTSLVFAVTILNILDVDFKYQFTPYEGGFTEHCNLLCVNISGSSINTNIHYVNNKELTVKPGSGGNDVDSSSNFAG